MGKRKEDENHNRVKWEKREAWAKKDLKMRQDHHEHRFDEDYADELV